MQAQNPTKVLFVINKKAGLQLETSLDKTIEEHAKKNAYPFERYLVEGNSVESDIEKIIENFNPTIIAAVGGDGTINLVASLIYNTNINLIVIPLGSANGMAKELQIPLELPACFDLIVKGKIQKIDLLKVNDKISVHLADVGLNARVVKRFELDPKRGLSVYAKHLFFEVFFLKNNRFKISYDNKFLNIKAVSLTFANATKYGTSAVINPDGILNDGFFEICIVKPFPKYKIFKIAYQMFRNTLKYSEYYKVISCKEAQVMCTKRTLLQNDGELMNKVNTINLKSLPNALNVIISPNLLHPTIIN
ncbi:diacylglycerol/lipid kinase family protein [Pedobacter alpinus]|uniref:Diacylglycerol/lipid kinase family protein n=1 Tax=Pedobacter alpinus TaxID=1590643 RepID=A0ABW5TVI1_9SPHI